jgi:hypothetical protein
MQHMMTALCGLRSPLSRLVLPLLGLGLLLTLCPASPAAASTVTCPPEEITRLYVTQNGSGDHSGNSWANALPTLQDALYLANTANCPDRAVDEIWVAAGIYYPDEGQGQNDNNVNASFRLWNGLSIYGGFAGTESVLDARDWTNNLTVLSGDIQQDDLTAANGVVTDTTNIVGFNSYHVVTGSGTKDSAILDGFTITAGRANGGSNNAEGGGIYTSRGDPTLRNISFVGNMAVWGGGMHNENLSYPTLINVSFSNNSATREGGGLNNFASYPTLIDVSFTDNWSVLGGGMHNTDASRPSLTNVIFFNNRAEYGGGMFNITGSRPTLTNVTFRGNAADYSGGGMFNQDSSPTLTNVTFKGNFAQWGGGMFNWERYFGGTSDPILTDVSFIDNSAIEYGGGMFNHQSNSIMSRVSFISNSASMGGAMYNTNKSSPQITTSTFWKNRDSDSMLTTSAAIQNIEDSFPIIEHSYVQGTPDAERLDQVLQQLLSLVTWVR